MDDLKTLAKIPTELELLMEFCMRDWCMVTSAVSPKDTVSLGTVVYNYQIKCGNLKPFIDHF